MINIEKTGELERDPLQEALDTAWVSLLSVPSYVERKPDTMTVTVMYRNNWFGGDGWTYYPKTVTISAYCPKCGAHRGEPYWTNQPEDGEWFQLNRWDNPCGHLDTYHEALIEAREQVAK